MVALFYIIELQQKNRTVAASGITPGQRQPVTCGITAGCVWDHCRMCVLMSGNSGYRFGVLHVGLIPTYFVNKQWPCCKCKIIIVIYIWFIE